MTTEDLKKAIRISDLMHKAEDEITITKELKAEGCIVISNRRNSKNLLVPNKVTDVILDILLEYYTNKKKLLETDFEKL